MGEIFSGDAEGSHAIKSGAVATDLSRVDRRIGREPTYQSKSPQYGLLVFGPEAEFRVWLVLDGDVLYIDRNGNGDLTEPGECVRCSEFEGKGPDARKWFDVGDITPPGGRTKYPRMAVLYQTLSEPDKADIHYCRVWVETSCCQHAGARLAGRRAEAPVMPFGGPLTMLLGAAYPASADAFARGERCEFGARVGSVGLGISLRDGKGIAATLFCQQAESKAGLPLISPKCIPGDVYPVAAFEFPGKDPSGPPIRTRVALNRRC